jgi:EAL domain-containing protein (putative c-di-GMP-specific phosphodiesterase class I)
MGRVTLLKIDPHIRRVIETDLPAAIDRGELFALFQPQVEIATRKVVSVEALARWRHPQLGEISPDVFITIAEEKNEISRVSRFMLDQACRQATAWRDAGLELGVSVNVSPLELASANFCTDVLEVLRQCGTPPAAITLEVTETRELSDADAFLSCIEEARKEGLGISVDDYGSGFSSLRRMHQLDASEVKLDRSLIKRGLLAEVQDIVAEAHRTGARIVAEGVETADDLDVAREMNCDRAQGWLFGRPMSADDIAVLARRNV